MNLESKKVVIQKSDVYLFEALSDVKNFQKLMPENTAKFEVLDSESFIFGLSGMPEIKLRFKEKTPSSQIVLGAASDKLPFTLIINIFKIDELNSEIQLNFDGEFNSMMSMMIKGPIGKFIDTLSANMTKL
jgi:ribosome-associated toxin RatA of RatAB toxin-antitoxin module